MSKRETRLQKQIRLQSGAIGIARQSEAISKIQRLFRRVRSVNQNQNLVLSTMTTFILNPYDQCLDLSKREHLRLYTDGCEGLEKEQRFDEKRRNYDKFVKLFGKRMKDTRVKECLRISVEWEKSGTNPELPIADKMIDLFQSNAASKDQVKNHCDLIWNTADFGDPASSKLFCDVTIKPNDLTSLDAIRNKFKMKHAMLGRMLWNSLDADFQLEIGGENSVDDFKRDEEYDGVQLWHFIQKHVNPSTTTGAASFKDSIKSAVLKDFNQNIKALNTWFNNERTSIIKEEEEGKYNE